LQLAHRRPGLRLADAVKLEGCDRAQFAGDNNWKGKAGALTVEGRVWTGLIVLRNAPLLLNGKFDDAGE
jgi:hypothetical protein